MLTSTTQYARAVNVDINSTDCMDVLKWSEIKHSEHGFDTEASSCWF